MRILLFGYRDAAKICLEALIKNQQEVVAVVGHKESFRVNNEIWDDPLKEAAHRLGVDFFDPDDVYSNVFLEQVKGLEPDLIAVFGYMKILKDKILTIPKLGVINLHNSLLPKYRGRFPLCWSIINNDGFSGATVHWIDDERVDSGRIISQVRVPIELSDDASVLYKKIADSYPSLLGEALSKIKSGKNDYMVQDEKLASYHSHWDEGSGRIDWESGSLVIYNLIRALVKPYPGAFSFYKGRKIYIWKAELQKNAFFSKKKGKIMQVSRDGIFVSTSDWAVKIKNIQFENEKEVNAASAGFREGELFGQ